MDIGEFRPSYEKDTSLAKWMDSQRANRETMKPERVKRLNSIGFPWASSDGDPTGSNVSETHSFPERNEMEVNDEGGKSDSSFGTANKDTDEEGSESDGGFDTANEGSESDHGFDISNKGMSVGSSSTSDKKPGARKPTAEYSVGTKVTTVRTRTSLLCAWSYSCLSLTFKNVVSL